jgi:protein involved in polysaccharide export with SLBB domain
MLSLLLSCGTLDLPGMELPANSTNSPSAELQPGDKILWRIAEDPMRGSEPAQCVVGVKGELLLPVSIGFDDHLQLHVAGKSAEQVREEARRLLEQRYYYKATIFLRVLERPARPGQVLCFGAVRNNRLVLEPNHPLTLLEGVLLAGPTEFANLQKVKLSRLDQTTGREVIQIVNVAAIKKDRTRDFPLRDGDRIEIPVRKFLL